MSEMIAEIHSMTNVRSIFLTNGKSSLPVNYFINNQTKRAIRFTRSDGKKVHTLPLSLSAYPVTVSYSDGSQEIISLK